jgi:hypothetical protein
VMSRLSSAFLGYMDVVMVLLLSDPFSFFFGY